MNHLVFLNTRAGELEKILSGVKTMIMKEFDPAHPLLKPGDSLYFLRDNGESAVRVKATVTRVLFHTNDSDQEQSHILKEMQSRLQFTEDQYNHWSAKHHILLVEFNSAQKIDVINVSPKRILNQSDWLTFDEFNQITVDKVSDEY